MYILIRQLKFGEGLHVGHMLASYTLQPYFDLSTPSTTTATTTSIDTDASTKAPIDTKVEGGWRHVVTEAIESTRITYPVSTSTPLRTYIYIYHSHVYIAHIIY